MHQKNFFGVSLSPFIFNQLVDLPDFNQVLFDTKAVPFMLPSSQHFFFVILSWPSYKMGNTEENFLEGEVSYEESISAFNVIT